MKDINKPQQPKAADQPQQPDKPDLQSEDTEYAFNLGLYRIETLNNILVACAQKYLKAMEKRDDKRLREYQNLVNTLYTESYVYMEEETGFTKKEVEQDKDEILTDILDKQVDYSSEEKRMEQLRKVRAIYLEIRQLLKNVGLDIPREDKIGDTEIFQK